MNRRNIILYSGATAALSLGLATASPANIYESDSAADAAQTEEIQTDIQSDPTDEPLSAQEEAVGAEEYGAPERPTPPAMRPPHERADRHADPQAQREETPQERMTQQATPRHSQKATDLMEIRVENHLGEQLGSVSDLAIDANTGRLEFIAVGPGDPVRVVPPQALQHLPFEERIVVNITEDEWNDAPTISRTDLAQLAPWQEAQEIYQFYDIDYPEMRQQTREGRQTFGSPAHRRQARHAIQPHMRGDSELDAPQPEMEFGTPPARREVRQPVATGRRGGTMENQLGLRERMDAFGDRSEPETEFRAPPTTRETEPATRGGWRAGTFERELELTERLEAFGPRDEQQQTEFAAPPRRGEWRTEVRSQEDRLIWVSDLIGESVSNREQESIGEISDFILNLRNGQIQHAIVWHENGQQFAIPMGAMQIADEYEVTIRPTLASLREAPRYEERQARLRPHQPFIYEDLDSEYGVPEHRDVEEMNDDAEFGAPEDRGTELDQN